MVWKINEVETEVHAFDATALLTDEVMAALTRKLTLALARQTAEAERQQSDAEIGPNRRAEG